MVQCRSVEHGALVDSARHASLEEIPPSETSVRGHKHTQNSRPPWLFDSNGSLEQPRLRISGRAWGIRLNVGCYVGWVRGREGRIETRLNVGRIQGTGRYRCHKPWVQQQSQRHQYGDQSRVGNAVLPVFGLYEEEDNGATSTDQRDWTSQGNVESKLESASAIRSLLAST